MNSLLTPDTTQEELFSFIDDVISSQILVSELEPAVTGADFSTQILSVLEKINQPADPVIEKYIDTLKKTNQLIREIDDAHTVSPETYNQVCRLLAETDVEFEPGKIFQADAYRDPVSGGPSALYQEDLKAAILFLQQINPPRDNPYLTAFTKKFNARFEGQEIPLLQALDTETGIPYGDHKSPDPAPLKDDLVLPETGRELRVTMPESELALFRLLLKGIHENKYELELKQEDFPVFEPPAGIWAPSHSVMFRITDNEERPVYLEMCGNCSANSLLSRFAGSHQGIAKEVMGIAQEEEHLNNEIIFAEIIHLPENRVGNILLRPASRKYEIPYLGASSVKTAFTLPADDLFLKAAGGKLFLYSKRLQKRIVPRLSAAHYFGNHSLPVYHFLCDMQAQGQQNSYSFTWGNLSGMFPFLPRVVFGKVILHAASWQLDSGEISRLVKLLREENKTGFLNWLKQRKIPDQFFLAEGDNELPVDIRNPYSLLAFSDAILEKKHCMLREMFLPGQHICGQEGQLYNGQYLATLLLEHSSYNGELMNRYAPAVVMQNRSFPPGSEWLYLKIYCGIKTAEEILQHQAGPFIHDMMKQGLIKNWFFIRYFDTDFHLRLRIQLKSAAQYAEILNGLSSLLTPLLTENLVSGWQIDTYHRELERYGPELIEETETLFTLDSQLKLAFLDITEGDKREQVRWLFGLKNADWLMDCLGFDSTQKENMAAALKESFAAEFHMNKFLGQQINQRFSQFRSSIEIAFGIRTGLDLLSEFYPVFNAFEPAFRELGTRIRKKLEAQYPENTSSYIGSCIHMMLNRLFVSDPRIQEMVLYEFLHKVYQAKNTGEPGIYNYTCIPTVWKEAGIINTFSLMSGNENRADRPGEISLTGC
ncbi:MAG: lantibiotic dehydratase [Chitinophagaceae bacterium]|nr:lantibiotic dehydratase [Chitinophagaceae bacterium]